MRILVATDQWFPDHFGGVARVATETARRLAARGHQVVVIAPRRDGSDDQTNDGGLTLLRVLPRGRLPQTLIDPTATRRGVLRLVDREFDVVMAHGATTASGLLAAHLGCPLVYVFHASAADEARYLRSALRPGRAWLAAAVFERPLRHMTARALGHATSVIVLSQFSRSLLSQVSPAAASRAVKVQAGVDTRIFSPDHREEARTRLGMSSATRLVFTARRFEPRMGLENLLLAGAMLGDIPDLRIAIAGSGDWLNLDALRDRLFLGDRVDLLGRVSEDDLARWYVAADLVVLPTVAYEGFGLVTAEALASGTPVVGTPVGATPELLAPLDPRLISSDSQPVALADAIRTGLRLATPAFRTRCREYAVEHFSWERVIQGWERVLKDAVG